MQFSFRSRKTRFLLTAVVLSSVLLGFTYAREAARTVPLLAGFFSSLFGGTELYLDGDFTPYVPKVRVGVQSISIERSRIIRYFGFRGFDTYQHFIDYNNIRRKAKPPQVVQFEVIIRNGGLAERPIVTKSFGEKVGEFDRALQDVVDKWQSTLSFTPWHFSSDDDEVKLMIRIYHGGKYDVTFKDFEVSQPKSETERRRYLNHISKNRSKIRYLLPLRNFILGQVRTENVDDKFKELDKKLTNFLAN